MSRRFFGLHPIVLVLASTHFIVDGFGNILTPLLPVIIPRLNLSLAAAGTLQMLYLMANSVSQLGPATSPIAGDPGCCHHRPLVAVSVVTLIGVAQNIWMLGAVLILGGFGAAAFHPPAAALVHRYSGQRRGLSMSFHIMSPVTVRMFSSTSESLPCGRTFHCCNGRDIVSSLVSAVMRLELTTAVRYDEVYVWCGDCRQTPRFKTPIGVQVCSDRRAISPRERTLGASVDSAATPPSHQQCGATGSGRCGCRMSRAPGGRPAP